jgi:hypothetical protein
VVTAAIKRLALACVVALGLTQGPAACGSALRSFDEVNNPDDDSHLTRCRNAGRAAREAGAEPDDAFDTYVECTREAGLR